MSYFPLASRLEAAVGFFSSSDGIPLNQLCGQKHNCPHFEKEDNMNDAAFITQLFSTIPMIVPQRCVMNASVSFMLSSFTKWGQLCFCPHSWFNGMPSDEENKCFRQHKWTPYVRWTISRCFMPACGGKSSTFWKWHCLRKIALETKRLIHTWWTWCQITRKIILYPIQQNSMEFNQ